MKKSTLAALTLTTLVMAVGAGCAAPAGDAVGGAASAIGTAPDITSLGNGTITFYQADFGSASTVNAKSARAVDVGVTQHKGKPGAQVTEDGSLLAISDGAYTMTSKNNTDESNREGVDGLPKNIVRGAVSRLSLFSVAPSGAFTALIATDSPEKLNAFEKITIDGDTASYDTTTVAGRHATGTIALPGLADGTANYGVLVAPRELPTGGSLLGTHLFELDVACDAGGTACTKRSPFDNVPDTSAIENGDDPPLRNGTSCYSATTDGTAIELACVLSTSDNVWEQCHGGKWFRGGDDHTGPCGACAMPAQ